MRARSAPPGAGPARRVCPALASLGRPRALPEPLPANVDLSPEQQAIGGYGPLEPIARNTVNVAKIATEWPDPLRVAGSLVTNQVRAYDLLRGPVRDEAVARLSPLGHAHLNCLGRYAFTTQPPAELRPLRDPNARDGEDDGEF